MRKAILLAVVLFLMAMTASSQIKPTAYAGGGLSLPVSGELGDYWKMAFNFGGAFGIKINPMFEVTARFHYNSFPLDDEKSIIAAESYTGMSLEGWEIDGMTMNLMEIGVDFRFFIPMGENEGPFNPFLVIGGGGTQRSLGDLILSFMDQPETFAGEDIIPKEFGGSFSFGGGFNYMFSTVAGVYVEGRYNILMVDPENYGWFQARGGLCFEFGG